MLALPPDEHQLLSRLSQYLCYRGIIPVVVRSPSEALIHSRHSRFAAIILPENDPVLIRKVRSVKMWDRFLMQNPVFVNVNLRRLERVFLVAIVFVKR